MGNLVEILFSVKMVNTISVEALKLMSWVNASYKRIYSLVFTLVKNKCLHCHILTCSLLL